MRTIFPACSAGLGGKDEIVLLDADGDVVDTVSWGRGDIPKEVTLGRLPDGSERFELLTPSKGQSNNEAKIADGEDE